MAAANNISDCVIGKFTFKKRCNVSGSANSSVIQGSSESDMSAAEIVPTDDTSRSPLQPIQLTNAINTNVPGPQFVSKHFVSTTKDEIAAGPLAGSRGSAPVGGPVAGSSGSAPVGVQYLQTIHLGRPCNPSNSQMQLILMSQCPNLFQIVLLTQLKMKLLQ